MAVSNKIKMLCAMVSVCAGFTSGYAEARSGSVGVSIHFDVAPTDLIRTRNVAPSAIRSCTSLKNRVDAIWVGQKRSPTVTCGTNEARPLIVSPQTAGILVVRP